MVVAGWHGGLKTVRWGLMAGWCAPHPPRLPACPPPLILQEDDFAGRDVVMELMETDVDTDHQLPLTYDVAAISAYWGRRPVSVITRILQLLSEWLQRQRRRRRPCLTTPLFPAPSPPPLPKAYTHACGPPAPSPSLHCHSPPPLPPEIITGRHRCKTKPLQMCLSRLPLRPPPSCLPAS